MKIKRCLLYIYFLILHHSLQSMFPPPPQPAPEPTEPPLTASSITNIMPDGTVQIAPSSYFTPKIVYSGVTTTTFKKVKQTTNNKYDTTFPTKFLAKTASASLVHKEVNHPSAGALGVSQIFDSFLNQVAQQPRFIPFFQKLKVFVLHDIYIHLMKVYTNFNMQHPKTLDDYVKFEETYAVNKKTLVVNHLVNVIEAQTNGIMMQMFPSLPQDKASWIGNFLMQHESHDINTLIFEEEKNFYLSPEDKEVIGDNKSSFLSLLNHYFSFFNQYTSLLDKEDPTSGMNSLVSVAQRVAEEIQTYVKPLKDELSNVSGTTSSRSITLKNGTSKTFKINAQAEVLRNAKRNGSFLNPGIFFYDEETFRGIKIIPDLAQRIEDGNYQKVDWPEQIIADAVNSTEATYDISAIAGVTQARGQGYPIAYFKSAAGTPTNVQSGAAGLFVNMPNGNTSITKYRAGLGPERSTMESLHEQELLKEPDWLGTKIGILKVLKACLGDFSQIIGMGILNPCNEAIILKSIGENPASAQQWTVCQEYLETIEKTKQNFYNNNPPQT